ncbi:hypothetical protein NL676_024543 [Syzygium grande]|nr:hypothetical protein NL676_024543 [Syzygium grande]
MEPALARWRRHVGVRPEEERGIGGDEERVGSAAHNRKEKRSAPQLKRSLSRARRPHVAYLLHTTFFGFSARRC